MISKLLASGVLCRLSVAAIEWHDERKKGTRPIHRASGAPTNFSALLSYMMDASRGTGCAVDVVDLSTEGT